MKRPLRKPNPALVISLLALFVALGGTTYAATSLPKNSVGTKQLKKNAVTSAKIKNGAVTAAKLKNGLMTLQSGQTESGNYAIAGGDSTSGHAVEAISFPRPLASGLDGSHVQW